MPTLRDAEPPAHFSANERVDLRRLGLAAEQIDALDALLPRLASELRREVPYGEVRARQSSLKAALEGAERELRLLLAPRDIDVRAVSDDVLDRMTPREQQALEESYRSVLHALEACDQAFPRGPHGQSRGHRAAYCPVQWIVEAAGGTWRAAAATRILKLVDICWRAALRKELDPGSAVREYIKARRAVKGDSQDSS